MGDEKWLGLHLDFWDDTAAVFEPIRVVRLIRGVFPDAEVDPTDRQQVRLERELAFWSRGEAAPEQRATLIRQSWELYKTNGPTHRFVVPFPPAHRVRGQARRLSVGFPLPPGLLRDHREQLRSFLSSLRMGVPGPDDYEEARGCI